MVIKMPLSEAKWNLDHMDQYDLSAEFLDRHDETVEICLLRAMGAPVTGTIGPKHLDTGNIYIEWEYAGMFYAGYYEPRRVKRWLRG